MSDGGLAEKFGLADEFDVRKLRRELARVVGAPGPEPAAEMAAMDTSRSNATSTSNAQMHFEVVLQEKQALDASLKQSEAQRSQDKQALEASLRESEARRSEAEASNGVLTTQIESYKVMADSKLQLETKIARLEEDARRNAEDRREDKQRLASFAEERSQRTTELKQLQQRLRDKEEEVKGLAQTLTDMKLNEELVKTRAETVDQERLRMEKKLEGKEQDCSLLEKDLHGVKAQLRTQQTEYEAREEKIREMYEDALDEKEECEIRTKEHELKVFLLEEQLRADGQMPLTHLPEALTPDNSEEMDALRKNLKKVTAVRNSAMQRAEQAENEVHRLENELKRMQAHAKGDPSETGKLSDKLAKNAEEMDRVREEKVRTA
jgi:chromosome segregation ATPase